MPRLSDFKGDDDRWILSCDGGGVRGIITLHCLRAFEQFFDGTDCHEIFDMFAGTSTGAIIAGSLASDCLKIQDLIELYSGQREDIFARSFWSYPLGRLATKYRKESVHRLLYDRFSDRTLAACPKDIMITATDTVRSETIFFTSFRSSKFGTYRNLLLRHIIEASLSAPTYFPPHGRFIDGGVGIHNNPCYVAAVEALDYSAKTPAQSHYRPGKVVVFSFGTGAESNHMEPGEAMQKSNLSWIGYVIGEGMDQASVQQSNVMERQLDRMEDHAVFYRYQIFLRDERESKKRLEAILGEPIPEGIDLRNLPLDAVDEERFGFLNHLGERFANHLRVDKGFLLKPRSLHNPVIAKKASGAVYEACYVKPTADELEKYGEEIAREFRELDEQLGL